MDEKIEILKKINTDDSRYLYKICIAYKKYQNKILEQRLNIDIRKSDEKTDLDKRIINLNDIYCEKYFNTKMKKNLKRMIDEILKINKNELLNNKSICRKIIYNKDFNNLDNDCNNKYDIVELIKELDKRNIEEIEIIANDIQNEDVFKYEQLKNSIEIIKIKDKKKRNEVIYDYVYNFLKDDFLANNYCDFKNDKCIAQRHFNMYPVTRKDGCCFKQISKCNHLNKGNCDIECMACRLFVCPYLTKRGIGYWGDEFILLNAFLNKKQRKHLIFDFYQPKNKILEKINEYI